MTTQFAKKLLAASVFAAVGATANAADKVPTLGDVFKASGIDVSGHIDTSYTYLSGTGTFTSGTANRVFDTERRSFNLHAIDLTISTVPGDGWGGMVDLTAGSDAKVITSAGTTNDEFDITQAVVQYTKGPLSVMGGKFVTNSGAEVIKSPSDTNFSRSILFGYAIPFAHTGMRATYAVSDKITVLGGVNNGWDVVKESATANNGADGKTVELGISATPIKPLSLVGSFYRGEEPGAGVQSGNRTLIDVVATYTLSDAMNVVVNIDQAEQEKGTATGGKAKWNGIAAYFNYSLSDMWRASVRAEQFDDKNGFRTGVIQKWKEATLTLAYMPTKKVELRGEVRADNSNQSSFNQPDGTTKKSQNSFGVEALLKF